MVGDVKKRVKGSVSKTNCPVDGHYWDSSVRQNPAGAGGASGVVKGGVEKRRDDMGIAWMGMLGELRMGALNTREAFDYESDDPCCFW